MRIYTTPDREESAEARNLENVQVLERYVSPVKNWFWVSVS